MRQDFIFALKTFAAAVLALYIAFQLDLPKPSWSLLTVYVVSQPYTGMVQSKGLYRVVGTVLGGFFALLVLPPLSPAPALVIGAFAIWIALSVYISVLERSPRSYLVLVAGFTAALIAFPIVDQPGTVFETAVARCEEIILGILCAVVVHQAVLPQLVGPTLLARLDDWLATAHRWSGKVLAGVDDPGDLEAERRQLVSDAEALETLRVHATYDTPELRATEGSVRGLQRRMKMLCAVLVSAEDRLETLNRQSPQVLAELRPLLREVADWSAQDRPPGSEKTRDLLAAIDAARPSPAMLHRDWSALLVSSLLLRLRDIVLFWQESTDLRRRIESGERDPDDRAPPLPPSDHVMAGLSAAAAVVSLLLCSGFWIATAWPDGSTATVWAVVGSSIFASLPNPLPLIMSFLKMIIFGTAIALLYLLTLLPVINSFLLLVAVLAPFYLTLGMLLARPRTAPLALPVVVGVTAVTALQNDLTIDVAASINSGMAQVIGLACSALVLALFGSAGAAWSLRRQVAAIHRGLARAARGDGTLSEEEFYDHMLAREADLVQQVAGQRGPDAQLPLDTLAALRLGLNLFILRRQEAELPTAAAAATRRLREALSRHFEACAAGQPAVGPSLGALLDAALAAVAAAEGPASDEALRSLAGIRQAMTHHDAFFGLTGDTTPDRSQPRLVPLEEPS